MAFEFPNCPMPMMRCSPTCRRKRSNFITTSTTTPMSRMGNKLLAGSGLEGKALEEVVKASYGKNQPLFNNAGQHYNHIHFWKWMKPGGGGRKLPGCLQARIDSDLGGFDKFREAFIEAGKGQFGSGWAWLAIKDGKLEVMKTPNGENPLVHGAKPLLGVDVWEHSYYIDYRNARPKYLEALDRQSGELGLCRADVRRGLRRRLTA